MRRYLWDDKIVSREQVVEVIEACIENGRRRGVGLWCLFRKAEGDFVGVAGLIRCLGDEREVGVLYSLNPLFRGRGLAIEAARAALAHAFEQLGLERVLGGADPPNVRSPRVLDRLGRVEPGSYHRFPRLLTASLAGSAISGVGKPKASRAPRDGSMPP